MDKQKYEKSFTDSTEALCGVESSPDASTPLLASRRDTCVSFYSTTSSKCEMPMSYERKKRQQKRKIWKNVAVLVGGVGIYTMGLNPIDDLQSSLNAGQGLGVTSLSVKYAMMILGNLLTNTFLIRRLGAKWALVSGALLYSLYIAANFYPTWYTLMPMTVLAGLGGALMWTTLGNYLARLSAHYALTTGGDPDSALFFGLKGAVGYASAAVGSLASSVLLGSFGETEDEEVSESSHGNATLLAKSIYQVCGANYCNEDIGDGIDWSPTGDATIWFNSSAVAPVDGLQQLTVGMYALFSFCMAAAILGTLILAAFVDGLPELGIVECREASGESHCGVLLATVRMWRNPLQLLLVPISFVYGFQEAFWRVEFSKAYVTCALGIEYIGYLMVCYNLASLVTSFVCGWLGTRNRRIAAFVITATVDASALVAMLFWKPSPDGALVTFVITGVTGCTYGALSTLLLAFYGVAFPDNVEAAYSNLYFWSFLGSTLMYAWSAWVCLKVKLIVVLCMVVIGIIGYGFAERRLRNINRQREKDAVAFGVRRFVVPAGF